MRAGPTLAIGGLIAWPLAALAVTLTHDDGPPEPTDGVIEAVFLRVGDPEWCSLGLDHNDDGEVDVWADVDGGDHRTFCDQATRGDRVLVTEDTAAFAYGARVTVQDDT